MDDIVDIDLTNEEFGLGHDVTEEIEIKNKNDEKFKEIRSNLNIKFISQSMLLYKNFQPAGTFIIGADIGQINFVVSIYCVEAGKMVDYLLFKLRDSLQYKSVDDMAFMLKGYCTSYKNLWKYATHCFIERQRNFYTPTTLVNTFRSCIRPLKSTLIHVESMRKSYREHFPKYEIASYENNKQNAVTFGMKFVTDDCKQKLAGLERTHDILEACLFAKYGWEFIINKQEKKKEPKKRKSSKKKDDKSNSNNNDNNKSKSKKQKK